MRESVARAMENVGQPPESAWAYSVTLAEEAARLEHEVLTHSILDLLPDLARHTENMMVELFVEYPEHSGPDLPPPVRAGR